MRFIKAVSLTGMLISIFSMSLYGCTLYQEYKYSREIDFARVFIQQLSKGNIDEITRMSVPDSPMATPRYVAIASDRLKDVDISTMQLIDVSLKQEDGVELYIINVDFEGDEFIPMTCVIQKRGDDILMRMAYSTDMQ